ncbi:MAG: nitronate monooxygenase [Candidatus Methylacidiphilales bacterium]|nr:nitronate monooxygenase [Candidatus Methylacidiphilales bacterium]
MSASHLPPLIQGGMGVAVSGWRLARAVSMEGQLGVVSGTALDLVMVRRLQMGDPGGALRRAFAAFPIPSVATGVWERFYIAGGKSPREPFVALPMPSLRPGRDQTDRMVLANFCEIHLAKEGHGGKVGLNLLEKIQLPTLPSLYGALLAGVDVVLMGAGIPRQIPGILDRLARGEAASLRIDVAGSVAGEETSVSFDPAQFWRGTPPPLARPLFLAIVSSSTLATNLARKSSGRVDGFVVEGASAGGHNAPPRGPMQLTPEGEPVYGPRDEADLAAFRALGLPFWLAGGYGQPGGLEKARAEGAQGIQAGTVFAFCEESGLSPGVRQAVLRHLREGRLRIKTDPRVSPTGFPFKVVQGPSSWQAPRGRVCDLGYLREAYRKPDGGTGFRCPGEPEDSYLRKGGKMEDMAGRSCVCNGLMASIGLGQLRPGAWPEMPLVTAGDALARLDEDFSRGPDDGPLRAAEVVRTLLGKIDQRKARVSPVCSCSPAGGPAMP